MKNASLYKLVVAQQVNMLNIFLCSQEPDPSLINSVPMYHLGSRDNIIHNISATPYCPSGFLTKIVFTFHISRKRATWFSHPIFLDVIIQIILLRVSWEASLYRDSLLGNSSVARHPAPT
jgi:hypothetical protein